MKRSLAFAIDILAKLGTCLAACVGCSSKNLPAPQGPGNTQLLGQWGSRHE
jgi:hypothetical protein